mgnify:CR=1 FL=1|tara:strand:+ start:214 stop:453 length:240 start_codon:yes stop_codon:yes gene_type:complete
MQHSIEELIRRINAMHDVAVQAHRIRTKFSNITDQEYDKQTCRHLIEQVQSMALAIAYDNQGDEIKTEMDYKNVADERI